MRIQEVDNIVSAYHCYRYTHPDPSYVINGAQDENLSAVG